MKKLSNHIVLIVSMCLYVAICFALHPILGYMLDSDGIAYLTIAKRVANGQYLESINGLWSPLNSWLLVPFIQQGYDAWMVSKALNCFFGAIILIQSWDLFRYFKLQKFATTILMCSLSIMMAHAIYLQMYGDVLQLIFVLAYIRILCTPNYFRSYPLIIASALIMGIGFYAKAYSFPFFILLSGVLFLWQVKQGNFQIKNAILKYAISAFVILLCVLPWSFALHKKYNEWSLTGFAGKMNMSWQINSGKSFRSDIKLLIPPSYSDSPSFWEDPYPTQEGLSSPISSAHHFVRWIARIVHTCFSALNCFNEISFLALFILIFTCFYFLQKRTKEFELFDSNQTILILLLTALLLPLGYLMMHIETRYIWLEQFIIMILGAKIIERSSYFSSQRFKNIAYSILAVSCIAFPVIDIKNLKGKNQELFEYANEFKQHNIQGSFTSNATDAGRMWVVAYLSNNPFFTIERSDYSTTELIQEMKRYHVRYYLFQSENNKPDIQLSPSEFRLCFKANGFDLYELVN